MGKSVIAVAAATAAVVLAAPATASAVSVDIGDEFVLRADAPQELVDAVAENPSVYSLYVSKVRAVKSNVTSEKQYEDEDESAVEVCGDFCTIKMVADGFGKSDVDVTWSLWNRKRHSEVRSEKVAASESVSVLTARVGAGMCDKLFDGVKLTRQKMFKQHDGYSYDEEDVWLASATRGYRFAKGSGYKVISGGKAIRFSKGMRNANVRMAKGDTRITVTLGVVHSQKALRKKLLSYFPKKRWNVHGKLDGSSCVYTVDAEYRKKGTRYLGIATGWYTNGEFYGFVPSKG